MSKWQKWLIPGLVSHQQITPKVSLNSFPDHFLQQLWTEGCRRNCLWTTLDGHTTSQSPKACDAGRATIRLVSPKDIQDGVKWSWKYYCFAVTTCWSKRLLAILQPSWFLVWIVLWVFQYESLHKAKKPSCCDWFGTFCTSGSAWEWERYQIHLLREVLLGEYGCQATNCKNCCSRFISIFYTFFPIFHTDSLQSN